MCYYYTWIFAGVKFGFGYDERLVGSMKFDYRGIVMKMKNTLEHTYRLANCYGDFYILMMVFDMRVEDIRRDEYQPGDMIRVVSSSNEFYVNVEDILEYIIESDLSDGTLSADELCEAFRRYCEDKGSPIFSEIYPIYDSGDYHTGINTGARGKLRPVSEQDYQKCLIAVCGKAGHKHRDDIFSKLFPCFYGTFYELITREYLKTFVSGVANNLFAQPVSLPVTILSIAGVRYIAFWGRLISPDDRYGGVDDFALNINRISELAYETREIYGRIIFCDRELPDDVMLFKFKTPYSLHNHKLVRKLIQIVEGGYCLAATYDKIYGIISDDNINEYRERADRLFSVSFVRERIWKLDYLGNLADEPYTVFSSEYENYKYAKRELDEERVVHAFMRFNEDVDIEVITAIIASAMRQKHGTMIVFSKEAEAEADRLGKTCIPLKTPINLADSENAKLVQFMTSIDGAVMCDENGICHAIGVILDGFTSPDAESQEDISRGARHNSAYRYLYKNKGKCIIVILSEDGDISLIS